MIEFLLTSDDNLIQYIPTLLNSISKNNKESIVNLITLYDTDISLLDNKLIPDNVELRVYKKRIKLHNKEKMVCKVVSDAMFLRIFAPEILVKSKKVIYLDIDTIVNCDLEKFYKIETSNSGLAGVLDLYTPTIHSMLERSFYSSSRLKLPEKDYDAFNSGVLLMDLEKMRFNNSTDFMYKYLIKNYMTDQPLINIYAQGDFIKIGREYNVSANHLKKFDKYQFYGIIHWHGKKPWESIRPMQEYYDKYLVKIKA